jgi:hypothetical protein
MTTLYTSDHQAASRGGLLRPGAAWRSGLRDIAVGVLVFAALLAFGALPIALRFWLAMPELTKFSH